MTEELTIEHFAGRKIVRAEWREDVGDADKAMTLVFADGKAMCIADLGQSCCEARYATCDDDLKIVEGETLIGVEDFVFKDAESEYDEHEQVFIGIKTTGGTLTVVNHNEHNGYYGGFWMQFIEQDA